MSKKETTRELISELVDLELTKEYRLKAIDPALHPLIPTENIEEGLQTVKNKIRKKTEGIDHFMVELNRREYLIDAEIEAIKDETARLRLRRKAVESMKNYFKNELLPMIVEQLGNDDGVYETDTARYKMFETWGPTVIYDETKVPKEYRVIKQVESINKIEAKKDMKCGIDIPGMSIIKVKRVRRS